jgi:5-(carboxyamino)imidazole ribonucleotide synthase
MFVQAAQRMGFRTIVLSPTPDAPAAQIAHDVVVGPDDDPRTLDAFAARADAVTVEFENVSAAGLRWLGRRMPARPGWRTVRVSQNRLREKRFLQSIGVPLAAWRPVRTECELSEAVTQLGTPLILKTAASGYDGKGQIRVDAPEDLATAWARLNRVACVAEQVVDFVAEVSVVAVRGADGMGVTYPVALNRHSRHILDSTLVPAPIGPVLTRESRDLATRILETLGTVGVLTVEMFLGADGRVRVNELAPRPHNSGHWTIEGSTCSQFEQQVRTLAGWPVGEADAPRAAAMVNLLGDLWGSGPPQWADALGSDPGVHLHLYGKHGAAPGRKMGHMTVIDADPDAALSRALAARSRLTGGGCSDPS